MDLLREFVIPPSENHVMLLKYLMVISLVIFIPYISMVLGASFISTYFNKRGRISGDRNHIRFAKDVIERLTISRSAELALGAIPAASILFAYAQLLYASNSITVSIMAVSVLLFMISLVFIYKYRNSFQVARLLDTVRDLVKPGTEQNVVKGINKLEENVFKSNELIFNFGKWLLFFAAYLFIGTRALASNPARWEGVGNILQIIFSWQTVFDFLTFLSIAGAVTGAAILFFFFKWPARTGTSAVENEEYANFVRNFAGKLTFFSALSFPVTLFFSYLYLPSSALSVSVFVYSLVIFVLALVTASYIYSMIKNSDTEPAALVFAMIMVILLFNLVKDQEALASAIEPQLIKTVKAAHELEQETKAKLVSSSGIDAAQIYNTKCIACHKFDQRVVGPPYQQTVPKYNGDVNKLSEFIFNPQKIDPAFPPMPNQGLKKKEAQAMAKWLIEQVSAKK